MRTGPLASGLGHGAFIALAVFGLPWFAPRERPPVRVTEVSFVSEAAFEQAQSAAAIPGEPEAPAQALAPVVEPPEALPEPAPPPVADAPAPAPEPEAPPGIASLAPSFDAEAPLAAAPEGVTLVPPAPTPLDVVPPPRRRPVERIEATPAPPPPDVAQPAATVTPEQSAQPAPEPLEAQPPEAPPEAAPAPPPAPSGEVAASAPPRPRPARPAPQRVATASAPDPSAEPEAEPPTEPSQAESILERLRARPEAVDGATPPTPPTPPTETAASGSLPAGPPITSGERNGLVLAVQRCWNVPAGLRDAQELKVTLAAELTATGEVISGSIRLVEPSAPDGRFQQAYEAGRRALIRCSPYTDLPREKYAQWREIEVVFNPEGMVSW